MTLPEKARWASASIRLWHPLKDLSALSDALTIECERMWLSGDQRTTPLGELLSGTFKESYWCSVSHPISSQPELLEVFTLLLSKAKKAQPLIQEIVSSGGCGSISIQFHGKFNLGDRFSAAQLRTLSDLGLDLEIEVFPDMKPI